MEKTYFSKTQKLYPLSLKKFWKYIQNLHHEMKKMRFTGICKSKKGKDPQQNQQQYTE